MNNVPMLSRSRIGSVSIRTAQHVLNRRRMVITADKSAQSADVEIDKRKQLDDMSVKFCNMFKVPETTPQDLYQRRASGDDMIVLDCRNPDEQDVSMIEGAIRQSELDLDSIQGRPVVCYCTVGYRSSSAVQSLLKQGVDAYNLRGSIMAWTLEQYPLVDGKDPSKPSRRVHSYSSAWALQGQGYTAVSYSWPAARMAADAMGSMFRRF